MSCVHTESNTNKWIFVIIYPCKRIRIGAHAEPDSSPTHLRLARSKLWPVSSFVNFFSSRNVSVEIPCLNSCLWQPVMNCKCQFCKIYTVVLCYLCMPVYCLTVHDQWPMNADLILHACGSVTVLYITSAPEKYILSRKRPKYFFRQNIFIYK